MTAGLLPEALETDSAHPLVFLTTFRVIGSVAVPAICVAPSFRGSSGGGVVGPVSLCFPTQAEYSRKGVLEQNSACG
jgi:hypothetical protein